MEYDEVYVPKTREQLGLPKISEAKTFDYAEMFEETPLMTFFKAWIMQFIGWWMYLSFNTLGSPMYPEWSTNVSVFFLYQTYFLFSAE